MDAIDNEDAMVFVLAHEHGHHVSRHILKNLFINMPVSLAVFTLSAQLGIQTNLVGDIVTAQFSQKDEREADVIGHEILEQYGYSGVCAGQFFDQIDTPAYASLLSTHPHSSGRQEALESFGDASCTPRIF